MEPIHPGKPGPNVPLSPGVRVGELIFVSGQVATNPDGSPYIGSFEREVNGAIDNVAAVMEAAGGSLSDVAKVTAYLTNAALFGEFNALYAARFTSGPPARTTVIAGFGHPDVRVELEAIGHIAADNA